jgi:Putative mono-oxygenase ydhR
MIVRIVTFRLDGIDEEQYQHHAVGIADTFNRWTGLRAKLWLADRAAGVYGGVYLFDGQEAADQSRSTPGFQAMLANPAFADLSVREYDVLEQPTSITASGLLAMTG